MRLYFVRHFKTQGNFEKRYIGRTDESIDFTQKLSLQYELPQVPDKLFSSPMKRCLDTSHFIYPEQEPVIVEGLQELDFGFFENKTYEELKENIHYRNFIDGIEDPLDGESKAVFKERCCRSFQEIVESCEATDCVVIVCHGGTLMSIMEAYEAGQGSFYDYQIANGGVLYCEYENQILKIKERG